MSQEDGYKIIVPINIGKLKYVDMFIQNCKRLNISPLYVISISELDLIDRYSEIDYVISPVWSDEQGVVTRKKFFGLDHAFSKGYKYCIALDCGCEIIKPIPFDKIVETYNKDYYCNDRQSNPFIDDIIYESGKVIGLANPITNYYTWFNEIPIYNVKDYYDFKTKFNFDNINGYCFDHLMFQYYMVKNEKRKFVKISNTKTIESIIESSNCISPIEFEEYTRIAKPLWRKNPTPEDNDVYVRLHLDR